MIQATPITPNGGGEIATRARRLRQYLASPDLTLLMEAHNALSAKIVDESGFHGVWVSSLTVSASLGLRDCSEVSSTQLIDVVDLMAEATAIPILVDADTGYGNFNNARRLARTMSRLGIAGICLEDKLFPKTNSLLEGGQTLADADEFCGKIKACKDSQVEAAFCVIARVEALIAGAGLPEALRRAERYRDAGADAILIHSKRRTADEVLAFAREWRRRTPLAVVPTTYYDTPAERFAEAGVSVVVWANHNLRAGLAAMRSVCRRILADRGPVGVEKQIASVADIFDLTDNAELFQATRRYAPNGPVPASSQPRA